MPLCVDMDIVKHCGVPGFTSAKGLQYSLEVLLFKHFTLVRLAKNCI